MRLRVRVSSKDPSLVLAQGASRRSFKPFAQAFGTTKRASEANAALIVKGVNCHNHLVFAMQRVLHAAQEHSAGNRLHARLKLIARHASRALAQVGS